jgi:hypothetical protein
MRAPASTATGRVTSRAAWPLPSVVTGTEPRYVSPSRNSLGNLAQGEFA